MSRRNKIIKVSSESVALKEMREKANLSLRKLADLMNLSFARVHQMESGKENVNEEYVRKFFMSIPSLNRIFCLSEQSVNQILDSIV